MAVSPDGSKVFVTGSSTGPAPSQDYLTVAYDAATGTQLWVRRYDGLAHNNDFVQAISVSPDGSTVFVTGSSLERRLEYRCTTLAYDASTGARLWRARTNPSTNSTDFGIDLAVSPDGTKVFVTGTTDASGTGQDYHTLAYDAATGAQLWATTYNGTTIKSDVAGALAISPDGSRVIVTGSSIGAARGATTPRSPTTRRPAPRSG